MFDLNDQILKWRENLVKRQTLEESDIDELESHLRDEIERLTLSGLSEQEAFLVAAHRLGQVDSLSEEFAKVNTGILWRKRFFWSGIIILICLMMSYIRSAVSQIIFSLATLIGIRGYGLNIVDTFSKMILFLVAVVVLVLIARLENINHRFYQIMNNIWGKVILFILVFCITAVTNASGFLSTLINARLLTPREFGQIAMFNSYTSLAWRIFVPVILLLGIMLIRPSKLRKSGE